MFKVLLVIFNIINVAWNFEPKYENTLFPPLPVTVLKTNNSKCIDDGRIYLENLQNFTLWAYEMYNSNAKTPVGLFRGNVNSLGHFEQCLSTEAPFTVQYCVTTLIALIPKPDGDIDHYSLHHDPYEDVVTRLYNFDETQLNRNIINLAWCLPKSCTSGDIENYLNIYVNDIKLPLNDFNVTYMAKTFPIFCTPQDKHITFDIFDIATCIILFVIVLVVLIATLYDSYPEVKDGEEKQSEIVAPNIFVLSFSAKRNYAKLVQVESHGTLQVLAGVRVVLILGIVFGHRAAYTLMGPLINFNFVENQYRSILFTLWSRVDLFVDSFFFLSGLLVVYSALLQVERKININPVIAIILRYVRLTPPYALVILFYATIFRFSGEGPIWNVIMASEVDDCRQYWWTNLLYVNNYVHIRNICLPHTWYLSSDFHFFIIGTFICMLLKRNKRYGLIAIGFFAVLSIVIPFVITWVFNGPAFLKLLPNAFSQGKQNEQLILTYNRSHTRSTSYFIGMFVGYFYHKMKNTKIFVGWIQSCLIIVVSVIMMLGPLLSSIIFYNPYREYNPIESAAFVALHRAFFILGSVGVLYVISFGTNRIFFSFLTWYPLIPLSKLVYGVYLTHVMLQIRFNASQLNPQYFSVFDKAINMLSDAVFAFFLSFLLYICVESPIMNFAKLLLLPTKKRPVVQKESLENGNNSTNNNNTTPTTPATTPNNNNNGTDSQL